MPPSKEFKVIIAGGDVAGLTLANMLERFDIDYAILEAHNDIAPAVGVSIGMFPNGLRILDQIGCYEPIRKMHQEALKPTYMRRQDGKPFITFMDLSRHYEQR
jgi:2-polyprenyl-6-methoxyphenol hydroxylase-like FAD-dependent oxidoreductase